MILRSLGHVENSMILRSLVTHSWSSPHGCAWVGEAEEASSGGWLRSVSGPQWVTMVCLAILSEARAPSL